MIAAPRAVAVELARWDPVRDEELPGRAVRRERLQDVYLLTTTAHDYFARRGFADCARGEAPAAIRDSWEFRTGCPTSSSLMRRRL